MQVLILFLSSLKLLRGVKGMRTIEVDDDVYFYLLGRRTDEDVTFSDLLRRAFGLDGATDGPRSRSLREPGALLREGAPASEVERWTKSPRFLKETTALGRFMCLLAYLHEKHGEEFESVLELAGRKRRYFARTPEELEETGQSVFPKQIAGSGYWVVTNTETAKKRQIVESVMRMMGYGGADILIASGAI
jgi:negative modulator of initiation of replication